MVIHVDNVKMSTFFPISLRATPFGFGTCDVSLVSRDMYTVSLVVRKIAIPGVGREAWRSIPPGYSLFASAGALTGGIETNQILCSKRKELEKGGGSGK